MSILGLQLDAAVRAVCPPIDGIFIGDESDKTTWGIRFQSAASPDQIAAGNAALAAFTPE